ncbi:MAG: HDOD domain-containing protein [Nitrospira sp.]|jgi:HD-like signal output (HDOD) protein|nr:HDOD domain-containing protein [Nitrospira sp.]MCW5787231.1 HDOD domain-containing protein [Nitrospira sp.]MDR4473953.1 HDOD domain-containing protein [Nitrospira sp.]MDR4476801.1 HDOD domain-containing protein [Nitrospira sp.]HAP42135.1 histidine kinase [Nitrospira sp.]
MSGELPQATTPVPTDSLEQLLIERIRKGAIELPLLPQVASRILAMVYDPDAEAAKLAALIHQDQALAAHVIRIANSPAYMTRNPVVSLQHAVSMLGMNLMSELAFSASIKGSAFKVPGWDDEVKGLWQYSLASGAYAKEIARMRRFNVESAYLCGLLHGIGRPVVLQTLVALSKEQGTTLSKELMHQLLDGYYIQVGLLVADEWGLPPPVVESIGFHVDYNYAKTAKQECMTTCLAGRMARHFLDPEALDEATLREHVIFADLNLYPKDVDALLAHRDKVQAVVEAMPL